MTSMYEWNKMLLKKNAQSSWVMDSATIWQFAWKVRQRVVFQYRHGQPWEIKVQKGPGLHNAGHLSDGDKSAELAGVPASSMASEQNTYLRNSEQAQVIRTDQWPQSSLDGSPHGCGQLVSLRQLIKAIRQCHAVLTTQGKTMWKIGEAGKGRETWLLFPLKSWLRHVFIKHCN